MMKWLFWLLLLTCMGLFVFMRWGEALLGDGSNMRPQQSLNEEKIKLLKMPLAPQVQPAIQAQASSPVPISPSSHSACMEWGEFSGSDLARAAAALDALKLGDRVTQRQVERTGGYWVYIPPKQNHSEVEKKIAQLKSLGVEEYFIVQEPGAWHNAISLGVFRTEDAAQKFLGKMREKGVKSAMAGERTSKLTLTAFVLKNPEAEMAAKMVEVQREFPGSELKAVACD